MALVANIHKKKGSLLALEKYLNKPVIIHCAEGREMLGTLKGFDSNVNVILANATEKYPGFPDRQVGTAIVRGSAVIDIVPKDGTMEIANPFV